MNENENPGAQTLHPEKTLILKILNESDQILKTVNIKTNLPIDELVKAIDVNLNRASFEMQVLQMLKEKVDPLVKLGKDSIDLSPVLAETIKALEEQRKENQENYLIIKQLKHEFFKLRNWVLSDQSKEVPNIESEGLSNG